MLLIQSDHHDASTTEVIDWLLYFGHTAYERLNNKTAVNICSLRIGGNGKPSVKIGSTNVNAVSGYWYRRGYFAPAIATGIETHLKGTYTYLDKEYAYYTFALSDVIAQYDHINSFNDNQVNKLTVLMEAQKAGLEIPDTLVTGNPEELEAFMKEHPRIITKALACSRFKLSIQDNFYFNVSLDTAPFEQSDLEQIKRINQGQFLPSLFQAYVDKKYELRVFYLNGACYSMAIFSQQNEKTKIDFRNYDQHCPNRCVPYNLPGQLQRRIRRLMQKMRLNCGSLDLIYTPEGKYVFLEVNPVGQFQWLSHYCNFDIERSIAQTLLCSHHKII